MIDTLYQTGLKYEIFEWTSKDTDTYGYYDINGDLGKWKYY